MKHVETAELVNAVAVFKPMSRGEKLRYWAKLIRQQVAPLYLMHGLEFLSPAQLSAYTLGSLPPHSALAIAGNDPVLQEQGLGPTTTLMGAMRFFSLSLHETHAFSCDCGGAISNDEQARRIEQLAT